MFLMPGSRARQGLLRPSIRLLETLIANNSPSLTTTKSWAGYSHIQFIVSNYVPVLNANAFFLRVITNTGIQLTNYVGQLSFSGSGSPGALTTSTTAMQITGNTLNTANSGNSITATLINVSSIIQIKQLVFNFNMPASSVAGCGGSSWNGTAALVGGLFVTGSGNILQGTIDIYGII